jgi:hypothetical protein
LAAIIVLSCVRTASSSALEAFEASSAWTGVTPVLEAMKPTMVGLSKGQSLADLSIPTIARADTDVPDGTRVRWTCAFKRRSVLAGVPLSLVIHLRWRGYMMSVSRLLHNHDRQVRWR